MFNIYYVREIYGGLGGVDIKVGCDYLGFGVRGFGIRILGLFLNFW